MAESPARKKLKILCFGDSLTQGYMQWTSVMAPYSRTLAKDLRDKLEKEWEVEVDTQGSSGELVMSMSSRMGSICKHSSLLKALGFCLIFYLAFGARVFIGVIFCGTAGRGMDGRCWDKNWYCPRLGGVLFLSYSFREGI
jgi:hypothetical protein